MNSIFNIYGFSGHSFIISVYDASAIHWGARDKKADLVMWTSLQTLTKDSSRPKEPERRSAIGKPQPLGPGLHLFLLIFIDVYFSFTSSFHHHPGFASPFVLRLPPAVSTLPSSPNVKNLVARGRASEKERGWWRAQNWFDLSLLTNFFCFLGHSLLALFFS